MRLGFACAWDRPPELTWSHTPWQLRQALRDLVPVDDLGIEYPEAVRLAFKASYARRSGGRWVSMWRHSDVARAYGRAALSRSLARRPCDVVLQIQDLAVLDVPYLVLQDLSYDVLLEELDRPEGLIHFPTLTRAQVERFAERQHRVYDQAAGIVAMSRWFAGHLTRHSGVPADRVHVVHPGASAAWLGSPVTADVLTRRERGPRTRLLLVGKDFHTKGGDLVVEAVRTLRAEVDPAITLTVVGPKEWPLPTPPPDGVAFRGRLPVDQLAALYDEHDLFVMPSRFEGFGIALVEALSRGLPCVARDAYAMPEIVRPGHNGALVGGEDPAELAAAILRVLGDDDVYRNTAAAAGAVRNQYSWSRAAGEIVSIADAQVG